MGVTFEITLELVKICLITNCKEQSDEAGTSAQCRTRVNIFAFKGKKQVDTILALLCVRQLTEKAS